MVYYYPGVSRFEADGTLIMRATGFDGDIRWTGSHSVSPADPEYAYWCWLREGFRAASPEATPFCNDADLRWAREEFRLHHRESLRA